MRRPNRVKMRPTHRESKIMAKKPTKPASPTKKKVAHPPKPPRNPFTPAPSRPEKERNDDHARDVRHL